MSKPKPVTLVDPKGREYTTTDRAEATNLKARGYKVKAAKSKTTPQAPATTK